MLERVHCVPNSRKRT